MPYIIGLLIILGLIFSGFSGITDVSGLAATALNTIKNKIDSIIFPKNPKEILVENILSDYGVLKNFFSGAAENILKSDKVSETDKTAVRQALEAFKKSEDKLQDLNQLEKEDRSLVKSAIEKVLNLRNNSGDGSSLSNGQSANQTESAGGPTYIPPQCRLECQK